MEIKNREALLTNSDGSLSCKMDLVIDDALPINIISDKIIEVQTIKTTTINNTTPSNILKNSDDSDRFVFLVRGYKDYDDVSMNIFYDTLLSDFIIIPDIDYYDLTIKRFSIKVRGKRLGSVGELNRNVSTTGKMSKLFLPTKSEDLASVDLVTLNLHGFYNREDGKMSYNLPDNKSFRKDVNALTFIKMDKNKLFGTDTELPVYVIEPGNGVKFVQNYVGNQNTDYIYFLLHN